LRITERTAEQVPGVETRPLVERQRGCHQHLGRTPRQTQFTTRCAAESNLATNTP
jgi:hypothetical protein